MSKPASSRVRAIADLHAGNITATVDIEAPPERVFRALASQEIVSWWVSAAFRTTAWRGDVRVGGRWHASGLRADGGPWALEGEFLEIDPPRKLVHTWALSGVPNPPTTVSYVLEPIAGGTRLTLRHTGFDAPEVCTRNCVGWEGSLARLVELLSSPSDGAALPA
jgi:uncharacterized protein YndB with AHSA1/START domain